MFQKSKATLINQRLLVRVLKHYTCGFDCYSPLASVSVTLMTILMHFPKQQSVFRLISNLPGKHWFQFISVNLKLVADICIIVNMQSFKKKSCQLCHCWIVIQVSTVWWCIQECSYTQYCFQLQSTTLRDITVLSSQI